MLPKKHDLIFCIEPESDGVTQNVYEHLRKDQTYGDMQMGSLQDNRLFLRTSIWIHNRFPC